jgi:hypothetical protein
MEDVGIFYGHLVHFTVFCYILRKFGIFRGNFFPFRYFVPKKIWQPWLRQLKFPAKRSGIPTKLWRSRSESLTKNLREIYLGGGNSSG